MESARPYRPRLSRETRLLITAAFLAVAALWLLARVRFRDRPVTPNPVPAVLEQLKSSRSYDDLADGIGQLQTRLQNALVALDVQTIAPGQAPPRGGTAALRLRDDLAVTVVHDPVATASSVVPAYDPASGLAVVRVPTDAPVSRLSIWQPRALDRPRYLIAGSGSSTGTTFRPTFIGSLQPVETPLWSDAVWALPDQTELAPGSFLFTQDAEFVGVVIASASRRVVMPGSTLFAEAERLLERPRAPPGRLGVQVQRLTSVLAAATGSAGGVVVSWVDPRGPAIGRLNVGDVLEALDGRAIASVEHWLVPIARLAENDKLELRVRRQGQVHSVTLIAAGDRPPETGRALGLTLRARRRLGAEVIGVELRSAADRADVRVGDVITLIGPVAAPTPEQVRRAFSATPRGQPVLIALTRDDSHLVTALER